MIGVLTYDYPHMKTYDILCMLKAFGYHDVFLILQPWEDRKRFVPLYEHRPENTLIDSAVFLSDMVARNFGYGVFEPIEGKYPECEMYLIAGAGMLGEPFSTNEKTINVHPGYLPNVRGLDALKWAIYEGQPIGVTTHIIDKDPDAGKIIHREYVPIYPNDTFHALAQRQYESEIRMLIESIDLFEHNSYLSPELYKDDIKDKEIHLLSKFQRLVEKS